MPQSLTCWETARRLNVKPLWVHRLIDRGDLKVVGDGVTEESVKKLLRRREARKRPAGYVSIKRASVFLGVSRQRVQQLCDSGALRSRSVEGRVWIDGESVFRARRGPATPVKADHRSNPTPALIYWPLALM